MADSDTSRRTMSESAAPGNPPNLVPLGSGDFPVSETPICKLCNDRDAAIFQSVLYEGKIYHAVPICPICFLAVWAHGYAVGDNENVNQIPLFDSEPS